MSLSLSNDLKSIVAVGSSRLRLAGELRRRDFDELLSELVEELHTRRRVDCTSGSGTETHMRPVDRLGEGSTSCHRGNAVSRRTSSGGGWTSRPRSGWPASTLSATSIA